MSAQSLKEYNIQLSLWKKLYGSPSASVVNNWNPTEIQAIKHCKKCGAARENMSRHHIANDYLFACLLPEVYAKRYIAFNDDDVAWLCTKRCHNRIHALYATLNRMVWNYVTSCRENKIPLSITILEEYKEKYRKLYYNWVKYKPKVKR